MKKLFYKILLCAAIILMAVTVGLSQGVKRTIAGQAIPYSLSGGMAYCAGQTGPTIVLSGSETGYNYQLRLNGINIGSILPGTGAPINFGTQAGGGVYDVIATNISTGCITPMNNTTTVSVNAIPIVTITASGPTTFCGSGTVTLSTPYEAGTTYQWQANMVNIFAATGTSYSPTVNNTIVAYTCVATNLLGCSSDATIIVTSNPLPQQFTVSTTTPLFCDGGIGGSVDLGSSSTGVSYQLLRFGIPVGTPVAGTGLALLWSGLIDGTYTVDATNNTSGCTTTMTGSATLVMDPLPNNAISITGLSTVCENTTITYSTGAIINATSYTWSVPAGATILTGQNTPLITVQFNGASGNVSVFGTNACGAGQPFVYPVTVNAAPSLVVTSTAADVCDGTSTTLNATAPIGTSFAWSSGGFGPSVVVTPSSTTTYNVTATGVNTCTSTGSVLITVHALPTVTLALSPTSECQSTTMVTLTGGAPLGGIYNGSCVSGINTVYPGALPVNTYPITYTYTDSWGCVNTSAGANFTINPVPVVSFAPFYGATVIPLAEPPFIVASGLPIGGVYSGPGFSLIGTSYWFDASAAGNGTHMGTYTYTQPSTGCSASQILYYNVGWVGVDEVNTAVNAINIFPNPANDYINFAGINTQEIKSLMIINLLGEVVYTTDINAEDIKINVSGFATGAYFVRFIDADGISISKKIMKN
ncbi:MAG: T9SS type A sorting domain-containing protein [Candidatus Absconditabacterales bacterium]